MKVYKARIATIVLAVGLSGAAQAGLHDRGGGLIYDDVLNVTWLQDANYAQTSGDHVHGLMTWSEANSWASDLSYYDSVRKATYTDWRLPTVNPVNGTSYNFQWSTDGSTDFGYNMGVSETAYAGSTASELAYMFYINLGNPGAYTPAGALSGCYIVGSASGNCLENVGPFINLQPYVYWSGSETPGDGAWTMLTDLGFQHLHNKTHSYYAWAVRDGDVAAIPEPETYAMMLAGLGLVGAAARRRCMI